MGMEEDNVRFFSDKVDRYSNNPSHRKAQQVVSNAFREHITWIGVNWMTPQEKKDKSRAVRLLDYACGTGVVTQRLGPHISESRGVDITPGMVEAFNKHVSESGISPSDMSAIVGNILKDPIEPEELLTQSYYNFDIVVVALGFHHFTDPADAAKRLAERLKPGGVLLLVDLLGGAVDDKQTNPTNREHAHRSNHAHGFTEAQMRTIYGDAGLEQFDFKVLDEPLEFEHQDEKKLLSIFFTRGFKPIRDL